MFKAIENELGKSKTDRGTWELVNRFWADETEYTPEVLEMLVDRVELLEARMFDQHGWCR